MPTFTDYIAATTALHLRLVEREKVPELTAGQVIYRVEHKALKRQVSYGEVQVEKATLFTTWKPNHGVPRDMQSYRLSVLMRTTD